jgi:hypothetical protein
MESSRVCHELDEQTHFRIIELVDIIRLKLIDTTLNSVHGFLFRDGQ